MCVRRIAAKRSARYAAAVALMEWPLFITLTIPHDDASPLLSLRRLRKGFGKLRHTKLWKARTVGGVAGLEINSRSGAFHPHLHAVIDCKWLAWYTRPPQRGDSKATIKAKCIAASEELGLSWARAVGVKSMDPDWCGTIFKVKRCDQVGITSEVLKYSVKGADLVASSQPIAPIIRALQATRLVTSFGTLFARRRFDDGAKKLERPCDRCGGTEWMPDIQVDRLFRSDQ